MSELTTPMLRVTRDDLELAAALAEAMSQRAGGVKVSKQEALRTALREGLAILCRDMGVKTRKTKR